MNTQVSFETINNKQICTFFSQPKENTPAKKIIIMTHGFRGSSIGPARIFIDFERLLLNQGFSVLRFDQPCCGNSEGDYLSVSFNQWVETTAFFTRKYLELGYQVGLLGQSMGATTSMIVAAKEEFRDRVPCVLLWVPDAKTDVAVDPDKVYEEQGQQYKGKFWIEASQANFPAAVDAYQGGIHLVYGETDKYVSEQLRQQTIAQVTSKGQPHMVLSGQDHSSWEHEQAQKVFQQELAFLKKFF